MACPADALDNNTCSPNLQKWTTETACIFLGRMLTSVATTSVDGSEEAT